MLMWSNGKFLESQNPITTLNWTLHYGGSVWEGIRSYKLSMNKQSTLFRLTAHINRLFDSAKILRLEIPYTPNEIMEACRELQRRIGNIELYFRPIVYPMALAETTRSKVTDVGVDIYAMRLKNVHPLTGIKVVTAFEHRSYPEYLMQCKSSNNYGNTRIFKDQAKRFGADDVLLTDKNGHYTEASTANLFVIRNNLVMTPPNDGSILPGITRGILMELTKAVEKKITHIDLITASEVFMTGTFAEVTPIIEIDGYKVDNGEVGSITQQCRKKYLEIVRNPLWNGIGGQLSSSS